jgi:hypothetical protein
MTNYAPVPVASSPAAFVSEPRDLASAAEHSLGESDLQLHAAALARRALRRRVERRQLFGPALAQDGVWNMLLELLAGKAEGRAISIKCLWVASGLAHSTSLRWVNYLVARGHVTRSGDPTDGRRQFIELGESLARDMALFIAGTET